MSEYVGFDQFYEQMLEDNCYNIATRPKGEFPMSFLAVCMNRNGVAVASDSKYIEYRKENGNIVGTKEFYNARKIFPNDNFVVGIVGQTSRILSDGSCERIEEFLEAQINKESITPSVLVNAISMWFKESSTFSLESTHLDIVVIQKPDEEIGFPYEAVIYLLDKNGVQRKEVISRELCFYLGDYACCNKELLSYFGKFDPNCNAERLSEFCEGSVFLVRDIGDKLVAEGKLKINTVGGEVCSLLVR